MIKNEIILLVYEQANTEMVLPLLEQERTLLPSTYMHSIRTAIFSTALAYENGYSGDRLKNIAIGALLHDVGKLHIPIRILTKPGPLTGAERHCMESHPLLGLSILPEGLPDIAKNIVSLHHEKNDGSGYPYGRKNIPDYVQIVTIADMFEAMTSKRHYKAAYSSTKACAILKQDMELGRLNSEFIEFFSLIA